MRRDTWGGSHTKIELEEISTHMQSPLFAEPNGIYNGHTQTGSTSLARVRLPMRRRDTRCHRTERLHLDLRLQFGFHSRLLASGGGECRRGAGKVVVDRCRVLA